MASVYIKMIYVPELAHYILKSLSLLSLKYYKSPHIGLNIIGLLAI